MKIQLLQRLAGLVFCIFLLNTAGSFFGWYIILPWYDNMMHFLGGAWLGLVALFTWFSSIQNKTKGMTLVLVFTLVGAILWECLEYFLQLSVAGVPGLFATPFDSLSDIIFGLLGAYIASLYYIRKIRS